MVPRSRVRRARGHVCACAGGRGSIRAWHLAVCRRTQTRLAAGPARGRRTGSGSNFSTQDLGRRSRRSRSRAHDTRVRSANFKPCASVGKVIGTFAQVFVDADHGPEIPRPTRSRARLRVRRQAWIDPSVASCGVQANADSARSGAGRGPTDRRRIKLQHTGFGPAQSTFQD